MVPHHKFGREKFSAFSSLSEIINDCKGMGIQLTNDIIYSPDAYVWLTCASGVQCVDELYNLTGTEGIPRECFVATNTCKAATLISVLHVDLCMQIHCYCVITIYCIRGTLVVILIWWFSNFGFNHQI